MPAEEFVGYFEALLTAVRNLKECVDDDPSLICALPDNDYQFFECLIKELLWIYGG